MTKTAHDFSFDAIEGGEMPLSKFKGKVVLVVNTASKCGFSVQYGPLRALQDTYGKRGFSIIGVPSNDFNQEPLEGKNLAVVCQEKFLVNFPLTAKTRIRGKEAHPFYRWAKAQGGLFAAPKYNFHKYLIGPNGEFLGWYSTLTSPSSRSISKKIERALKA